MADFDEFIEFAGQQFGANPQQLERFSRNVRHTYGGDCLYVDKGYSQRDKEIRMQFDGRNYDALARMYGLSKRRIMEIVQ